jgi:hypothetical protein
VPDGVREAVLLRTSRLAPAERAIIEAAAVAGGEFDIDAVLAAASAVLAAASAVLAAASAVAVPAGAPGVPARAPAWPGQLAAAGLVTEVTDGRASFRHALTRDAAYADIPWSRRRELHRALAGRLSAAGDSPALVAAHLLAARDVSRARGAQHKPMAGHPRRAQSARRRPCRARRRGAGLTDIGTA